MYNITLSPVEADLVQKPDVHVCLLTLHHQSAHHQPQVFGPTQPMVGADQHNVRGVGVCFIRIPAFATAFRLSKSVTPSVFDKYMAAGKLTDRW